MTSRAAVDEERLLQLLHQIHGGRSEAVGELYVACEGYVFEVAYRVLRSVPDAEEVTTDVFLGMSAALQGYDHSSSSKFMRWLARGTVRLAAERANRIEAMKEVPLRAAPMPAVRPDPAILRLALEQALEKLTPALRTVFVLRAVEGFSHREISAMLGINVGASQVRMHRARKELRRILGDAT